MNHLQFEQWVGFPLEQVFLFFANPQNLPRITPPQSHMRLDDIKLVSGAGVAPPLAGAGTEIVTSFRPVPYLPFRAQWIALIVEFELNRYFSDIQKKGPFREWRHRHDFLPGERSGSSGTIVRDTIDYDVGFGFAGRIANQLFVRRTFDAMFAHRQSVLEMLLGS